ncbi:AAA family ATPase [Pseudonocardia sp. D17]|uniref:AAA family ATPase n=1 Tax=Pseudonocardia sp. D17 TaxID=882661 RepID=UPI002B3BD713|nr:LuxR family transcriptional regulator [Pseudonocardia sp. D17]
MPLVGRESETAALRAALDDCRAGIGTTVLLAGEPGIGKTTLAGAVAGWAREAGTVVLTGRTGPDIGTPPLWPWWQVLHGRPEHDVLAALPEADGDVAALRGQRLRAFETVARGLQDRPGGTVVVLEDLHWADEATLALLAHVTGRPGVLAVGTYRSTERPPALRAGLVALDRAGARRLDLRTWSGAEIAAVAADVHPGWRPVLLELSGGVPLHVRELVATLRAAGLADSPPARPGWPLGIPASLADITAERLSRLSPTAREAVGAAAVAGDAVGCAELAALCGLGADDALAALDEAAGAGLLVASGPAPDRHAFPHALLRDAVYAGLPAGRRVAVHRAAAAAVAAGTMPGEPVTHLLASATDEPSRAAAVRACLAAAAGSRAVPDRAAAVLDAALALPGVADADRCALLLAAAEAEFAAGLAEAANHRCTTAADLAAGLDGPARAAVLARASLVVRGLGGPVNTTVLELAGRALSALAAHTPDDDATRARVLAQRALAAADVLGFDELGDDPAEAFRLAERSGDGLALFDALRARQHAASGPDGVAERLEIARRMAGLTHPADAGLWGSIWRIDAALQLGTIETVDGELARLAVLAEQLGWPLAHWHRHRMTAAVALLQGRFVEAEEAADTALDWARRTEDRSAVAIDTAFRTELHRLQGRAGELVPALEDAARHAGTMPIFQAHAGSMLAAVGDTVGARYWLDRLRPVLEDLPHDGRWLPTVASTAQLGADLGDTDVAAVCARLLAPYAGYFIAGGSGSVRCDGSVSRVLGVATAAAGSRDEAIRHLEAAVVAEDRAGALPYRTMSEIALAGLLVQDPARLDLARLDAAAGHAERAAATARRLGMPEELCLADGVLVTIRRARQDRTGLTPREREITTLLAEGRTNREIAGRLVLSERTVESHVANVLGKLGLARRAQVAGWVAEHGPVR